jgi:hypothetical protein
MNNCGTLNITDNELGANTTALINNESKTLLMRECLALKAPSSPMAKKTSIRKLKRYQAYRKNPTCNNRDAFIKALKMIKSCAFWG